MNKQGKGKIEYLDYTYSPITGCLHDCSYCYMKRMAARFPQISMEPKFHPERLYEPLKVQKPSIIGVAYSGDMWGEWMSRCAIEQVLATCMLADWHRFLFLTKNPARYGKFEIPPNCWCGTSVTGCYNLFEEKRIRDLTIHAPEGRGFISLEPFTCKFLMLELNRCNWLIIGGLTGSGAKKSSESNVSNILTGMKKHNIPVFIKSNAGYPEKIQQYPEGLRLK